MVNKILMVAMETDVSFVRCLVDFLRKNYIGAIFQKLKKHDNIYIFKFYKKGIGTFILYISTNGKFIISSKLLLEQLSQDTFCQKCNKELKNSFISSIEQINEDRIVSIKFSNGKSLIIELFKKGNIILIDDDRTIMSCAIERKMKDRYVLPREKYIEPPKPNKLPDYIENAEGLDCSKTFVYNIKGKKIYSAFVGQCDQVIEKSLLEVLFEAWLEEIIQSSISDSLEDEKILENMRKSLEALDKKMKELKEKINYIEQHYPELENLINTLKEIGLENIDKCNEFLERISKGKARLEKKDNKIYLIIKKS